MVGPVAADGTGGDAAGARSRATAEPVMAASAWSALCRTRAVLFRTQMSWSTGSSRPTGRATVASMRKPTAVRPGVRPLRLVVATGEISRSRGSAPPNACWISSSEAPFITAAEPWSRTIQTDASPELLTASIASMPSSPTSRPSSSSTKGLAPRRISRRRRHHRSTQAAALCSATQSPPHAGKARSSHCRLATRAADQATPSRSRGVRMLRTPSVRANGPSTTSRPARPRTRSTIDIPITPNGPGPRRAAVPCGRGR